MSNVELDKRSEWFKSNRLSLNSKKTNYILFSPKYKCRQQLINSFTIQIDGKTIDRVENARFLGVYIDEKLQWNEHIQWRPSPLKPLTHIPPFLPHSFLHSPPHPPFTTSLPSFRSRHPLIHLGGSISLKSF